MPSELLADDKRWPPFQLRDEGLHGNYALPSPSHAPPPILPRSTPPSRPILSLALPRRRADLCWATKVGAHSPIASTSSTLPPSITHTSAVAAADSLAGTPPLTPPLDAAPAKIPDPAKHDPDTELLGYLARLVMRDSKLQRTYNHINLMLNEIQLATNAPPVPALKKALETVSPMVRLVARRKGLKQVMTPQALTDKQRTRQAWKWIVAASDKRSAEKEYEFGRRLALEVMSVLAGQSEAIKNYTSTHQQAVVNRAIAR
ncbi:37S ribosomal protein S7, mitochondrial [Rhodotorula toruloides]|nr:37S ribosomal protein S7, mitochondrial [Rhodotorula toruloides]